MVMDSSTTTLPPEFNTALHVFADFLQKNDITQVKQEQLSRKIWEQSNVITTTKRRVKIRDIPSDIGWRWNQAKRKYTIKNPEGLKFELLKLVPRKSVRSHLNTLPPFKLWRIQVEDIATIFWCEKGYDCNPIFPYDINDFEFLRSFMNPKHANEIWCSKTKEEQDWNGLKDSLLE